MLGHALHSLTVGGNPKNLCTSLIKHAWFGIQGVEPHHLGVNSVLNAARPYQANKACCIN